ncbi:hypothetical protein ALC57_17129, partial [Trachymyrmex cornetzi]
ITLSLNDLSNGEKRFFFFSNFKLFDILNYSRLFSGRSSPIQNSGSIPKLPLCRDRSATGGKAETQNVPNAKLIGASRRGVRPHRGGQVSVPGRCSVSSVRRAGRTTRLGAVSAGPDVATGVTSPVNYPLVVGTTTTTITTTSERLRPFSSDGHDMRG